VSQDVKTYTVLVPAVPERFDVSQAGHDVHQLSDSAAGEDGSGLRRRILDAAQRLVEQDGGLTVSLENLGMDRIIREAGVSRTSVYREWANKEVFYPDLLCDLAGPSWQGTAAFDDETIELARNIVAENLDDLATVEGREHLIQQVIKAAVKQNFDAITRSTRWRTYVALTATALSLPEDSARQRVQTALQASEHRFLGNMSQFYDDMATVLGYKLRAHVDSYETVAAVGASILEGLALRQILVPDILARPVIMHASSEGEEWHLAAISFLHLVMGMIEPCSDYDPSTALVDYLKRLASQSKSTLARG
jgi:AcrR family transcriptional regulator